MKLCHMSEFMNGIDAVTLIGHWVHEYQRSEPVCLVAVTILQKIVDRVVWIEESKGNRFTLGGLLSESRPVGHGARTNSFGSDTSSQAATPQRTPVEEAARQNAKRSLRERLPEQYPQRILDLTMNHFEDDENISSCVDLIRERLLIYSPKEYPKTPLPWVKVGWDERRDDLLERLIKGNPPLTASSGYIMRLLCEEGKDLFQSPIPFRSARKTAHPHKK